MNERLVLVLLAILAAGVIVEWGTGLWKGFLRRFEDRIGREHYFGSLEARLQGLERQAMARIHPQQPKE